ncbi:GFA family protein [Thiolinea disciformis]|uniref:GFA family protein n=1 Tax=Thiolinea disciformis TaxID=125614 RepID=UPI000380805D|nr:GFA family protein [Thiolinea disciformis]
MKTVYSGSCLCGAVTYEVDHIEPYMAHCHCSMCRKFHGAAFATYGEAKAEDFRWTSGENKLKSYFAPNGTTRRFCEQCGSSMTFEPANSDHQLVEFSLGTLDTAIEQRPDAHIYTSYKADWSSICDGLKRYPEERTD